MHAIEKELTKVLKIKAGSDEDRQEFLARLVKAAGTLDDEVFYEQSAAKQEWVNTAIKALKTNKDVPDFDEERKPRVNANANAKARTKDDDEPASEKKPAKKEKSQGMSSVMLIRHFLADNYDASKEDIVKFLEKGGHKVLSEVAIGTVRSDFRGVVRVLREKDMFKRDVTLGKE